MISTADFRNGKVLEIDGDLWEIVDFQHVKPGKGPAFVRTKYRNVLTGRNIEKTYRSGEKFEEARVERQNWQYLYRDGDIYNFMNEETYEQVEVMAEVVGDNQKWMKENTTVILAFHNERVIMTELSPHVELEVTQSDPGVQGDRSSGATKPATLETGVVIQVPLFVEEGNIVKVDTRTGDYITRIS